MGTNNYVACIGDGIAWTDRGGYNDNGTVNNITTSNQFLRGVFKTRRVTGFRDILDGTANTIMMGEIVVDSGSGEIVGQPVFVNNQNVFSNPTHQDCLGPIDSNRPRFWNSTALNGTGGASPTLRYDNNDWWRKGHRWSCSLTLYGSFNTVRPPNSESCQSNNNDGREGTYTAGSRHQGGCHVLMADGAVRFITDSIEAGTQTTSITTTGMPSPYGLWGSLGTSAGKEVIRNDF